MEMAYSFMRGKPFALLLVPSVSSEAVFPNTLAIYKAEASTHG